MKHKFSSLHLFIISSLHLFIISSFLVSCSSDDDPQVDPITPPATTDERPTDWITITDYLPYTSMIIYLHGEGLPDGVSTFASDDLLAAFADGDCVGVASPTDENKSFELEVLKKTTDENKSDLKIILKYYSAQAKKIFQSQEFAYQNDGILGSLTESYKPIWQ